jgi:hypothetical protein
VWIGAAPHFDDIASELQNATMPSLEAVEIIISWVGRALIGSTLQRDEESTRWCANSSLRVYGELRADLVHMIDTAPFDDIEYESRNWIEAMKQAQHFIYEALLKLREKARLNEQFVIDIGDAPTRDKAGANRWLPNVGPMARIGTPEL